jgi:uncharacterized membrane protein YkoI
MTRVLLILLLALSAEALSPSAWAQSFIDPRQRREMRQSGGGMSLDRAVRLAESRYGAKAVKATTVSNGDRLVHQIRLIRDGKVWTVNVDAQSGDMY